jgi:2,3-bisphosphoglycerate-independent phosphoglycerate mutase
MAQYDETFNLPVAFAPEQPTHIFAQLVSEAGWRQLRTAETEKYAHVTFFFNGGRELVFPGEDRFLVPSPRDVKTYDLKPEMSAKEVVDELCKRIGSDVYDFALVNLANPDMVGHTGSIPATVKAVEAADEALGTILAAVEREGGVALVTADHGNAEEMLDGEGNPQTAHTSNPVPLVVTDPDVSLRTGGQLSDLVPTMISLLALAKPLQMSGQNLMETTP